MSFLNRTKQYIRDVFRYPDFRERDSHYDTYWHSRDVVSDNLNNFQNKRVQLLLQHVLQEGDSVLDVGCGDGRILAELKKRISLKKAIGFDSSSHALEQAKAKGLDIIQGDVANPDALPMADVVMLLEVLEHLPDSEKILRWGIAHSQRVVVFSVPNSGFIFHRLRLLFGRFPLQWRAHPSEHLRFWTLHDMRWWLKQLGYPNAQVMTYEGIPVLNVLWPALFAAGLFITIPGGRDQVEKNI